MPSSAYRHCTLCARACGVDRTAGATGACGMPAAPVVARAALHFWEEPPISGTRGSGAVFFSGCSLGCVFCQNRPISHGGRGRQITEPALAAMCMDLQGQGAHNINLVTPTHFAPSVVAAVAEARARGLTVPVVYNTSAFDTVSTLRTLAGTVDVYVPDMKYMDPRKADRYSAAPTYPTVAKAAIAQMVKQVGPPILDGEGILQRGVLVRVLVLPEAVANAKLTLQYLHKTYGDDIYISIMSQYTPVAEHLPPPLHRPITAGEYRQVVDYAAAIGITRAFVQERSSAHPAFIPPFE